MCCINGDRSSRNDIDWEVEWIREADSKQMISAVVELGMRMTCGKYLI
jgi:hypothetical protein